MNSRRTSWFLLPTLVFLTATSWIRSQENDKRLPPDGPGWRVDEAVIKDPKLPRVLLIGDSILNGYLKPVREALKDQANIDAWVNPYSQASYKLDEMLAAILARANYDIVHFNMGLHGWQKGRIPEGKFEPLTAKLVEAIRKGAPNAKLIWASSTPVTVKKQPGQADPEINPIIIEHNAMAAKVMNESLFRGLSASGLGTWRSIPLDAARRPLAGRSGDRQPEGRNPKAPGQMRLRSDLMSILVG